VEGIFLERVSASTKVTLWEGIVVLGANFLEGIVV